ncbi:MAG: DUF5615 family PIN-like protein [Planctomycetes bacterium]|nr:DUF5615 family PIN-like protein [Planctomycetota bacterium]
MLGLVADENLNNVLVRGLKRRYPEADIVRVQDVGLRSADDAAVLQWAATQGRVVVTHDARTMPRFARERTSAGLPMPGVLLVSRSLPPVTAIEDLALLALCSEPNEWEGQVLRLPL